MTVNGDAIRNAPRVALYLSAAAVAIVSAALASQSSFTAVSKDEPMLVVAQPVLQKADRLTTVTRNDEVALADPAAVLPTTLAVRKPVAPRPAASPTVQPAIRSAALVPAIPPKPPARPCLDDCLPARSAATSSVTASPVVVASLSPEPDFIEPGAPMPPMPVVAGANDGGPGVLTRSGRLIGSVWGWSGNAVHGLVREVRERTF